MNHKYDHFSEKTSYSYEQFQRSLSSHDVSKVTTTFSQSLEISIVELISEMHGASLRNITDKFGDYLQVHTKLKEMLLEGKILRYERELDGEQEEFIKLVDPSNTFWDNMNAQPCLTCPIMGECGIENPVSPATCEDFADWLEAEIQLDMMNE